MPIQAHSRFPTAATDDRNARHFAEAIAETQCLGHARRSPVCHLEKAMDCCSPAKTAQAMAIGESDRERARADRKRAARDGRERASSTVDDIGEHKDLWGVRDDRRELG